MNIVTLNELTTAIEKKLDIDTFKAKKYANVIMDLFGFEDRIIDNSLEQKDRQLFYLLESRGLLYTGRERITLPNGRQWRIHYWVLAKNKIFQYSNNQWIQSRATNRKGQLSEKDTVYSYLPKDMWTSRKDPAL